MTSIATSLRRVDELESSGRLLEAIDALTDVNRVERSAAAERRLVHLRHRAFELLDEPGLAAWPPEIGDAFAGAAAPPEINAHDLTAFAIGSGIVNHGSVIVRGLVTGSRLERLQEDVRRAFAARDAERAGAPPGDEAAWFHRFEPGRKKAEGFGNSAFIRAVDSPPTLFSMIETYAATGLLAAVAEHLGERPAVSANKCALRRIATNEGLFAGGKFHQDGAFLGAGIRALNVWLPLSDCGGERETPGLDIVPRRLPEVLPTGTTGSVFPWSVSPLLVAEVERETPVVRPEFAAGDALLFDELLLHATGISPGMRQPRYAIECWFFAPSVYPPKHVPIVF